MKSEERKYVGTQNLASPERIRHNSFQLEARILTGILNLLKGY